MDEKHSNRSTRFFSFSRIHQGTEVMRLHSVISAIGLCALLTASAFGQLEGLLGGDAAAAGDPKYSAKLFAIEGTHEGVIEFTLEVPEGWKVYDVTEMPGGIGVPATMKLPDPAKTKTPNGFEISGEWVSDHEPKMIEEDGDLHPVHYGTVTWKAPVKFEEGVNPKNLKTKIKFSGQICATSCRPISESVLISFEGYTKKDAAKNEKEPAKKPEVEKPAAPSKKPENASTNGSLLQSAYLLYSVTMQHQHLNPLQLTPRSFIDRKMAKKDYLSSR
jgi:hypothetical protein